MDEDRQDGEGLPRARDYDVMRPLLACWTRARFIDRELGGKGIKGDTALQFEWLVRQAIRTSRADGSQMLADNGKVM